MGLQIPWWGSPKVQPDPGLGSMRLHARSEAPRSPDPSWRLDLLNKRILFVFLPVRGPAFTSLKVGVGHRLDAQASGVLGRWCAEPGVQ